MKPDACPDLETLTKLLLGQYDEARAHIELVLELNQDTGSQLINAFAIEHIGQIDSLVFAHLK